MPDAPAAARARPLPRVTWQAFLCVGAALVCLVLVVPGWAGEILWDVVPVLSVAAMVVGIRRNRPAAPRAWWLLTAGMAWGTAAEIVWKTWYVVVGDPALVPQWFDVLFLPTYPLLAAGFALLPRNSLRARHGTATWDAFVVVVGYALLYWALVYRGEDVAGAEPSTQRTISVFSLAVGLAVHFLGGRMWFRYGHHNASYAFLAYGLVSATTADVLYTVTLGGDAAPGISLLNTPPVEALGSAAWLVWFVLTGTAALHPRSRGSQDAPPTRGHTLARGVLFFVAVTVGPVTFLLSLRDETIVTVAWADLAVPLVTVAVLSGLIVGRLVVTTMTAQRRAVLLDQQATELAAVLHEQRALEDRLRHQALHDPLTGLGNRAHFSRLLAESDGVVDRAVLMVDLDGFKSVNDHHGHGTGDRLLRAAAERMRATVDDDTATVARLGGDEFAVVLDGADAPAARDAAGRLVRAMCEPFVLDKRIVVSVSASVGLSVLDGTESGEEVLRQADLALYAAKSGGRNQACVYTPRLREQHAVRLQLLAELQHAVRLDELVVHYQPVVDMHTRRILSVEALVRWDGPRGRVMPDQFIPLAEETGLIVAIGEHVLRRAVADARPWWDTHRTAVHVNISAREVRRPEVVDVVRDALAEAGLPGEALVLEITESALLAAGQAEADLVSTHLGALREMGVRVAIDDFGTGYSSLAYLQRLPVDIVKIDGAFVRMTAGDEPDARRRLALTTAIVELCATLDLQAVAEQIEIEEEADAVESLGCPLGQGYLFGRPVAAHEIEPMLGRVAGRLVQQRTR